MTEPTPLNIRLTPARHAVAKAAAQDKGVTMPLLMQQLLETWADGPMPKPPPRAVPQKDLLRTQVELDPTVRKKVERKAAHEGRSVSQVLSSLLPE